jgi:hypothetical protein
LSSTFRVESASALTLCCESNCLRVPENSRRAESPSVLESFCMSLA